MHLDALPHGRASAFRGASGRGLDLQVVKSWSIVMQVRVISAPSTMALFYAASVNLWCELNSPQQVVESWVGAQVIEYWIHFDETQPPVAFCISLFQPLERLVPITQAGIN